MAALPDRIWIVGPCGGGKSTVARILARRLGVSPVHLDEIHWLPGWREAEPDVEAHDVAAVVERRRWVVDGNYHRLRAPHLDRVQLHVWLDLPLHVTMPRLLRRTFERSLLGVPCCNGNRETLRQAFLQRDSILLWALTTDRSRRRVLTAELRGRPHVRLRSQGQIRRWLATVGVAASPHA